MKEYGYVCKLVCNLEEGRFASRQGRTCMTVEVMETKMLVDT